MRCPGSAAVERNQRLPQFRIPRGKTCLLELGVRGGIQHGPGKTQQTRRDGVRPLMPSDGQCASTGNE
jgi:hypothetical protein